MTTAEFIEQALRGTTRKDSCSSVMSRKDWQDGTITVYSYGIHYPLIKIIEGKAFINSLGYSNTTAKHIYWAWQAGVSIVGRNNVHSVPLTNNNSFNKHGLLESTAREIQRLTDVMATKKRKNTQVYELLEQDYNKMVNTLAVVNGLDKS